MTELEKLIEKALKAFEKALQTGQTRLAEIIEKWITKLDTKAGIIQNTSGNRAAVLSAQAQLERAMEQAGFGEFVKAFMTNFDDVNQYAVGVQKERGVKVKASDFSEVQKLAVQITTENLVGQGMAAQIAGDVRTALFNAVAGGGELSGLLSEVRSTVTGTAFEKRATQISRDALGQYHGLIQNQVQKKFNLNALEYVGSLVEKSRPQCIRWVEMETILLKDLKQEIKWAEENGSGLIEGTNEKNFIIHRGGHNCRHEAIPVRK
jgi:3-methyladenine DNA glycosylase Tag